jgi:hypothetical protein
MSLDYCRPIVCAEPDTGWIPFSAFRSSRQRGLSVPTGKPFSSAFMNGHLQHKLALEDFWKDFGGWYPRRDYSRFSASFKLARLNQMAALVIEYKKQNGSSTRRSEFNEVKSRLCRDPIGSPCFVCGKQGRARHHIIQLQNGGINARRNLVILCEPCHAKIHPWLK